LAARQRVAATVAGTMDCELALQKLSQYLDKELDGKSATELELHLAECRDCFSLAEFERRLRILVRQSCISERIPPEIEKRLRKLLQDFSRGC
jgi:anti-sigma factor (TIGR02949 family)